MLAFLISAAFGVFEMYLLFRLTTAVVTGNKRLLALMLLLKFTTYAAAIGLFVFFFIDYMFWCFCGFAIGLPFAAVVMFFIRMYRCGDGGERK